MAWRRLAGKEPAPLTHRSRRSIGEKPFGCPPRQGPRPGRGRRGKAMPTRRREKGALHCTSKGFLGAAAPKRLFRPFWAAPKGPRARGRETSPLPAGTTGTAPQQRLAKRKARCQMAGAFQITAKAAENRLRRQSSPCLLKKRSLWGPRKIGDFVGRGHPLAGGRFGAQPPQSGGA